MIDSSGMVPFALSRKNACLGILAMSLTLGMARVAFGQDLIAEIFRLCSDRHSPGWWQCRVGCPTEGESCGLACNEKYLRGEAANRGEACARRQGAATGIIEEILIQIERQGRSDLDERVTACVQRHQPDMVEALVCATGDRANAERRLDEVERAPP